MRYDVVGREDCRWIDVVGPSRDELLELAREFALPPTVVEDCLDPEHLPKYERIGDATFLILRARDHAAPDDASTIQELTRKVAVFMHNGLLLTVHRTDLGELRGLRERFEGDVEAGQLAILVAIILATLDSYDKPLDRAQNVLDEFEAGVFDDDVPEPSLRDAFHLKRRVALTRRILWQTSNVLHKLVPPAERAEPLYQDLREAAEGYLFWVDQLLDEVNQLLQAHLAMSSNRTNEVMRVLTVFSAFFLPLTFIVGVYGMNFHFMPELDSRLGYPLALAGMFLLAMGIFVWFRRRGWM